MIKKFDEDDPKRLFDSAVSTLTVYAGTIDMHLAIAIGLAAALFGPALSRRHKRAEDLLDFIRENPNAFTEAIFSSEQFQDGFVFFIEQYIRERNEDKLVIMRNIFAGFAQSTNLSDYPLEEMTDLIGRLRFGDISVFRVATLLCRQQQEQRHPYNQQSVKFTEHPFKVSRLIYFGLLAEDRTKNGSAIREHDDPGFLYIWLSPLGNQFADYLGTSPSNED